MTENDLKIAVASLNPGDKFVLKHDGLLSEEARAKLTAEFNRWASGVPVMVLPNGVDLKIISGANADPS